MIRLNLTKRIWLSFMILVLLVGVVIAVIYPLSIKGTLTEETYQIIESEQQRYTFPDQDGPLPPQTDEDFIERRDAARSVGHTLITRLYSGPLQGDPIPDEVIIEMRKNALDQEQDKGRYELTYNDQASLFYVISKVDVNGQEAYFISYMWDTYRDQMIDRLWWRLIIILFFALLLSLFPAAWIARYLRRPLTVLGERFEQIANRNWKEPFRWEGDEEFQKLSNQFELMRQNLMRYDKAQKTFIQHASHELKTPIMIIKSYAQSIKDGVMPDSLDNTMTIILNESDRMDQRVKAMLTYIKLDSIDEPEENFETFRFGILAEEIRERFMYQREDVMFTISGEDIEITAIREQMLTAMDNLVQNALRYANSKIELTAIQSDQQVKVEVYNDGEQISFKTVEKERLFEPFQKGDKGQFGIGLAIVKKIAERHEGSAEVTNLEEGVVFSIIIPSSIKK
ncbi:HAMP domain-containing sensor histidine kinase [Alkalihalobacillus macyae]|uniref:sensor histidine kinase n=1 Tax=Guptibacillus hwajinpoensis TaxID=208199 RepID=UPI00273B7A5C|nr:HAMP domain-containing sensor histidine kinase [Alkalihalobacillus macyae]MDP4551724.1 HAMP domain-containing sensor histidine kinase [Alkalihalobacillus macyae]